MTTKCVLHQTDISNKQVRLHKTYFFDNKLSFLLLHYVCMWVCGQLADWTILLQQLS